MSQVVLSYMVKINQYKQLILYVLITNSVIHALCGLNLIIGGLLSPTYKQRLLFLPWLTLDMIYIVLTTIVFVSWAFLSFFVHILVAIFFPVVSGAFLGKVQNPNTILQRLSKCEVKTAQFTCHSCKMLYVKSNFGNFKW